MSRLNVSSCTIRQVKKNLLMYYRKALSSGCSMRDIDAIFLWSSPGIGKSEMVQQITDELREDECRRGNCRPVKYVEIRLSECSIFELIGLMHRDPVSNTVSDDAPPIYHVDD